MLFYRFSASRLIVKSQPPPQPLFSPRSVVLDLYHGNLEVVAERIITEEIMVVYYYAPWCASSKRAGKEFEKAATYLQDEVCVLHVNVLESPFLFNSFTVKSLDISRSLMGNKSVDHSDVVGAALTGDAPTTSEWSTLLHFYSTSQCSVLSWKNCQSWSEFWEI